MRSFTRTRPLMLLLSCAVFIPNIAWSEEVDKTPINYRNFSGWSTSVQASNQHQFDADLDNGGRYSNNQYNIQVSQSYLWDRQTSASIALNYGYHDYHFSGGDGGSLAALSPWNKVHSLSISTPLRKPINENWSGFILPYVSFSGESNAEFNKAMTAGVFTAATYRFSKNLMVGSGLAVTLPLEDSLSVFPILMVSWNITDQLKFNLGGGSDATQGPGLTLRYKANRKWQYALGGYYQKLRFRLDKNSEVAGGIGEDQSIPLITSATYNLNPGTKLILMAGIELDSELTVEDSDGDKVIDDSSSSGLIAGITFNMRL